MSWFCEILTLICEIIENFDLGSKGPAGDRGGCALEMAGGRGILLVCVRLPGATCALE